MVRLRHAVSSNRSALTTHPDNDQALKISRSSMAQFELQESSYELVQVASTHTRRLCIDASPSSHILNRSEHWFWTLGAVRTTLSAMILSSTAPWKMRKAKLISGRFATTMTRALDFLVTAVPLVKLKCSGTRFKIQEARRMCASAPSK